MFAVVADNLYRDLDGFIRTGLLCRNKTFRFEKFSATGTWIRSKAQNGDKPILDGVRRLLYRVDDLQKWHDAAQLDHFPVFIPEGEKDCDTLWALGVPATSNDSGAGKWTADHTTQLTAIGVTHVWLLPDNDVPGRDHVEIIARACTTAGIVARIVPLPDLPPKGDVSDRVANGHTKAELRALCEAAPIYTIPPSPDAPTPIITTARTLADVDSHVHPLARSANTTSTRCMRCWRPRLRND